MTDLKLYNTLSRKKEIFRPLKSQVGLYTCGLTVYNFAHIGNLRTYIFEDILRRTLLLNGFKVLHVQNITDVGHLTSDADEGEDKMEKSAKEHGQSAWEIAEFYTRAFKHDLQNLNILLPDIWCKATDHISEQITVITKIEQNGYTYKTNDGIYFDTSKLKNYGLLTKQTASSLKAGLRVAMGEKKNSTDFALWKFSSPNQKRQMEWDSPWGKGFPGWHIECSAMANHYLGVPFDIHCGGIDHIAIHHNNEIAQTYAAEKKLMANFWLHSEFLNINQTKMAKSQGNFFTLKSIIDQGYYPLAYRYLVLNTHYRQKINFTWEALQQAQNAFLKILNFLLPIEKEGKILKLYQTKLLESINDDLNTPKVLALLWELIKTKIDQNDIAATIYYFDGLLGLNLKNILNKIRKRLLLPPNIKLLAKKRELARKQKDFKTSDNIRLEINQLDYLVIDTPTGQKIYKNITVEDLLKNID